MALFKMQIPRSATITLGGCQEDTFLASSPGDSYPVTKQIVL